MPNNVIKSFARQSGKTVAYIESIWKDLKDEYGNDYEKIVGALKKILKIDENKIKEIVKYIAESKGTYVSVKVQNHEELAEWFKEQGLKTIPSKEMHCTIAYSKKEFKHNINKENIKVEPKDLLEITALGNDGCLVLKFKSKEMTNRWQQCMDEGAMYDYPEYISHTTIALDVKDKEIINNLKVPNFPIIFGEEIIEELDLDWKNKLKESEMIKVGDKLTTNVKKGEVLFNKKGVVKSINNDMAQVDFGNGDIYGIALRRIKNKVIVEAEETYKEFFAKKLEKYDVKSPAELSDEDKKKFYDEVDAEWEGEKEEVEEAVAKYPVKYRSLENDMIVSFDGLTSGTVVSLGKSKGFKVGKRYQEFFPHKDTNTRRWVKVEESSNEECDLSTKALFELSKGNSAEFISIVKDAMFIQVGKNSKYPNVNEAKVSAEDVEYFHELTSQLKKDKKSNAEIVTALKKAGAPKDIIADLTEAKMTFFVIICDVKALNKNEIKDIRSSVKGSYDISGNEIETTEAKVHTNLKEKLDEIGIGYKVSVEQMA